MEGGMVPPVEMQKRQTNAMNDSLILQDPQVITRAMLVAGELAAIPLAELITPSRPVALHPGQHHRWRQSRYYRQCHACALVQDKLVES